MFYDASQSLQYKVLWVAAYCRSVPRLQQIANGEDDWYFITPRDTLLATLFEDVKAKNGDCSFVEKFEKSWGTKLQRKLCKVYPYIKADKRDVTWQYDFYSRGKVPCIGIPIASLPQIANILNLSLDELGIPNSTLELDVDGMKVG